MSFTRNSIQTPNSVASKDASKPVFNRDLVPVSNDIKAAAENAEDLATDISDLDSRVDLTEIRWMTIVCLSSDTDQTVDTAFGGKIPVPFNCEIPAGYVPFAMVTTEGTTGNATIDINKNGTTILSTKITIETTEISSLTAATQPVVSVNTFAKGDYITVDIDAIQTTPAKGLTVSIPLMVTSY